MDRSRETVTTDAIPVTRGSGNIFVDLGFDEAEAEELQVKAGLTYQIYNRIKALGLTQKQAAARLGISQPDVSKLMHCKYTGFSTDRLLAFLTALDLDIDIILRPCNDHVASHRVQVHFRQPRKPRLPRVPGVRRGVSKRALAKKRTGATA
jgi:predicted XRE-type DNA-binding protein